MISYNLSNGLRIWRDEGMSENRSIILDFRVDDESGRVAVVAVDENGIEIPGGYLAFISPDGKIGRYPCVNDELGFQLDKHRRIIEEADE